MKIIQRLKTRINLIYCFIILLIVYSCVNDTLTSSLRISIQKDTIAIMDTFKANLYFDNYKKRLPEFFIINKKDTNRLYFNDSIKCAVYKFIPQIIGKRTYKGYVEYYDSVGVFRIEKFVISFVVK